MGRVVFSFADYTGEVSSVTIPIADLTAANIDGWMTDLVDLMGKLEAIQRGKLLKYEVVAKTSPQGVGKASSQEAQREEKWLVRYYDGTTFERATFEVPCADLTLQLDGHPGYAYLQGTGTPDAAVTAFVNDFQTTIKGPGGNASVIESIVHVGRNT